MNSKTIKLIRKMVAANHGLDQFVENNGVLIENPHFKRVVDIVKKEYLETPRDKRAAFLRTGI